MAEKIEVQIALKGQAKVDADLKKIGKSGKASMDKLGKSGTKAKAGLDKVSKSATKLKGAMAGASAKMSAFAAGLGGIGGRLAGMTAALGPLGIALGVVGAAAALTGTALFNMADNASQVVSKVKEASIRLGISGEEYTKLGFAAEQTGASMQKLEKAFNMIADAAGEALSGEVSEVTEAFTDLGIELLNTDGTVRKSSETYLDIADKMKGIESAAKKSALATQFFGKKAGPGLVENLQLGREGIAALGDQAERLGFVFEEAELKIGKDFGDALNEVGRAAEGLRTKFGLLFAPAFEEAAHGLAISIAEIGPALQRVGELMLAFGNSVVDMFSGLGSGVLEFLGSIWELFKAFGNLGSVMGDLTGGSFTAWLGAVGTLMNGLGAIFSAFAIVINGLATAVNLLATGLERINEAMGNNEPKVAQASISWAEWATQISGIDFTPIQTGLQNISVWLEQISWDNLLLGADLIIQDIMNLFSGAAPQIASSIASMTSGASQAWDALSQGAASAINKVKSIFATGIGAINSLWASMKSQALTAWSGIGTIATKAINAIKTALSSLVTFLNKVWQAAKKALSASNAAASAAGSGKAQGGRVFGPGTATSDSIPAWLSNGEWVIKAAAVRKYGHAFMAAVNGMKLPVGGFSGGGEAIAKASRTFSSGGAVQRQLSSAARGFSKGGGVDIARQLSGAMRGFSSGGVVQVLPAPVERVFPGFATGGAIKAEQTSVVNLTIEGENFNGMIAPRDVAEKLTRYAVGQRVRSAGRKPNWAT
jgi:hypothetical protein